MLRADCVHQAFAQQGHSQVWVLPISQMPRRIAATGLVDQLAMATRVG